MSLKIAKHFTFLFSILAFCLQANAQTQTVESVMQKQIDDCNKNSSMNWSAELNRCVGKVEARAQRNESKACNEIKDKKEREQCHLSIASLSTGVSSDASSQVDKISSLQNQSALINTAATIVSAINLLGKSGGESNCMSKNILGLTSLGGFLTDVYMKINTKKKMKQLENEFIVDVKDSPYNAQFKALEYLKREQQVIKSVASKEKKRQMLLMIGYGAAAMTAAYEAVWNSNCGEGKKPNETGDATATASSSGTSGSTENTIGSQADASSAEKMAPAPPGESAQTSAITEGQITKEDLAPLDADAPQTQTASSTTQISKDEKYATLVSVREGNVFKSVVKDSEGNITGVIHKGQFYPESKLVNGKIIAVGKPTGLFDYNTGTWGDGKKVQNVAITSGYNVDAGKLKIGGNGSTQLINTSFGTNKIKSGKP